MRGRSIGALGALSLVLGAGFGQSAAAVSQLCNVIVEAPRRAASRKKVQRRAMIAGGFKAARRKAAPDKRKLKSNRLHVSKRVRRKHRRARA